MGKKILPLLLGLALLLGACGEAPEEPSPAPTGPAPTATPTPAPTPEPLPEPTPYNGPVNPLTGEPMEEAQTLRRPVAIMLNNLREAQPQLGQSQADILYEVLAEGGITRMLGVYQDPKDVGRIGSIRSSRPYYLELALGHDAIYIHAGGSEDAYAKIREWGVTSLDGVRGTCMSTTPNGGLMWRDPERRKSFSLEHTVVTTGEAIAQWLPEYSNVRLDHKDGYTYEMNFAEDGTPAGGSPAEKITVPFSNYKTGVFTYDPDSKTYSVEQYGGAYTDGDNGEQVSVTNVVVILTACKNTGDKYAHITVDLASGGAGYYACGGQVVGITWSKGFPDGQLIYQDLNGNPLTFGVGQTYVNIVPLDSVVKFE